MPRIIPSWAYVVISLTCSSRSFATDTTGQLDIFWHDSYAFRMDGTQVGVFKESNQVGFCGFLQGQYGRSLEAKIRLEILCDLTNKTLERQLANQQISRLLVATNFTKSHRSWAVTVGLLHSSGCGGGLASCLRRELLTRSLPSSGFTSSLQKNRVSYDKE